MKILIAEDDSRLGSIIAKYLNTLKLETYHCKNGEEAWRILVSQPVDMVITDWNMPKVSGSDLVKKIRQTDRFRTLPILMISGRAGKEDIVGAVQSGINGYLSKPFTIKQLKEKILTIWKQRHNSPLDAQIKRICSVHNSFNTREDYPLILFGEPANTSKELSQPRQRDLASYLIRATAALAQVKAANPGLEIGYLIETSTQQVIKRITSRLTRERVKLAIISTECSGNSTMLMRLLNVNKKEGLSSLLICDQIGSIPLQHQAALDKSGVEISKRRGMTLEKLRTLIEENIVGGQKDSSAAEELSPEEIRQRITKDLDTMATLPVLPQVYQKIMSLADDPDSELKDWSEAIKLDSMSCAVILRRARSPAYGFQSDVSDIERAVILLGKEEVKELTASESVKRAFSAIEESGFSLDAFWLHNVAVGFAAKILSFPLDENQWTTEQKREFASFDLDDEVVSLLKATDLPKRLELDSAENPFVGGLVHDIGKGAMVQCYPGLYPLLVEELKKKDWKISMLAAESEVAGGLTHAAVGSVLCTKWELGEKLCAVADHHHNSEADNTFSFLIGVADIVGQALYPFPQEAVFPLSEAIEEGDLKGVENFLPTGFLEQSLLSGEEFIALARAISPAVKKRTNEMRAMVG